MKIYAPKHDICEAESVGLKEIPLAFVNTEESEYSLDVKLNPEFAHDKAEQVRPYDVFREDNPYFFSKDGEILTDVTLKRRGGQYIYEPKSMNEYDLSEDTSQFGCTVLIKRTMSYSNDKMYNLKVGVAEDGGNLAFSKKLISIFGDANKRGKCPANITVNNGNLLPQSLIANRLEENHFFFAHSTDGKHIYKGGSLAELDIDGMMQKHVNLWLFVDDFESVLEKKEVSDTISAAGDFTGPQLYTKTSYTLDEKFRYVFHADTENKYFPKSKYRYELLHPSVLIMERQDYGYVIVTPAKIFQDFSCMGQNVSLIYEVLMNIYLRSYYESSEITSWITDEPVDYIAGQENKNHARHKVINLDKAVVNAQAGQAFSLVKVNTSNPNVLFAGLTAERDMLFYKITGKSDIPKQEGETSYLTTKLTVVNYKPEDIYTGESKASIDYEVVNGVMHATLHPFHSSAHHIYFRQAQTFRINSNNQEYCICTKESSPQIQNVIQLIDKYSYDQQPEHYGICIAVLKVISKPSTKTYDIRVAGGGLPEDQPDNYDMVDIGHVDGRPYRRGSTMIIRLPKSLKEQEEKIRFALKQHIAAGTYPVLLFE